MVAFSKSGGMDGGAGEVGRVAGVALNPVTVAFSTTLDALVRNCNGVKRGTVSKFKVQIAKPMSSSNLDILLLLLSIWHKATNLAVWEGSRLTYSI